eukprot:10692675-Prorocentrum_lima.AAC.1
MLLLRDGRKSSIALSPFAGCFGEAGQLLATHINSLYEKRFGEVYKFCRRLPMIRVCWDEA